MLVPLPSRQNSFLSHDMNLQLASKLKEIVSNDTEVKVLLKRFCLFHTNVHRGNKMRCVTANGLHAYGYVELGPVCEWHMSSLTSDLSVF